MTTLYERLGGEAAVGKAVEMFYQRLLEDDRVSGFFKGLNMERQIEKQKNFLTLAFGGPHNYEGRSLGEAHAHLVKRGLNDTHVDAVIENLGAVLMELGVEDSAIAEVAAIANGVRDEVLGRR